MITERHDQHLTIRISDDPIFHEFNFAQLVLAQVSTDDQVIILDLALVTTLHSPGLANLVSIYVKLAKNGKTLILRNVNDMNKRLLRATQLDKLLTISDSA